MLFCRPVPIGWRAHLPIYGVDGGIWPLQDIGEQFVELLLG